MPVFCKHFICFNINELSFIQTGSTAILQVPILLFMEKEFNRQRILCWYKVPYFCYASIRDNLMALFLLSRYECKLLPEEESSHLAGACADSVYEGGVRDHMTKCLIIIRKYKQKRD